MECYTGWGYFFVLQSGNVGVSKSATEKFTTVLRAPNIFGEESLWGKSIKVNLKKVGTLVLLEK